jgi:polyhydroxybutyrate depolymerase
MIVFAGTNDRAQFYDGAVTPRGRLMSVAETMDFWRGVHGCKSQSWRMLAHRNPDDLTQITVHDWGDCDSKRPVRLYRIEGGGHQLPTVAPASADQEKRFGLRNRDIEAADEIWASFKDLRR